MAKRKTRKKVAVDSLKHKDKRKNIPTEELKGFVREEDSAPRTVTYPGLLYARDPSLDPQLVWKGKDEQDREELTVPSVPIYIQEKIHPQAIVEDVRAQAKRDHPAPQMGLFSDFNGLEFEELIDFYRHDANWANRMILGDSLLVMTSLAEKEGLKGKVQMIYIDPPYGIKFASNWQVSTRKRDVRDGRDQGALGMAVHHCQAHGLRVEHLPASYTRINEMMRQVTPVIAHRCAHRQGKSAVRLGNI